LIARTYAPLVLLNFVVGLAIGLAGAKFALPAVVNAVGDTSWARAATCIATLIACSPFLFAIVLKSPESLLAEGAMGIQRLRALQFGVILFRSIAGLILIELIINQFARARLLPLIFLGATPVLIYFFR